MASSNEDLSKRKDNVGVFSDPKTGKEGESKDLPNQKTSGHNQNTEQFVILQTKSKQAASASSNEDLSKKNDNISSFSDSLNEEEGESNILIEKKTSNETHNIQKFLISGNFRSNIVPKTSTVNVSAMMIRRNGNYLETGRAAKTHAIRVNFKMFRNENIRRGNKEIHIVIQNPKGKVINEKGIFILRTGEEASYTDQTVVYYDENNLNVSILSDRFIQRIIRGTYIVSIYIEAQLTGQTFLILN